MFGLGVHGLECVFHMSESGLLEVMFPQLRSTGETSRVSDASEMSNGIFLQSLVDHFRMKGLFFFMKPSPACCGVGLGSYSSVLFLI